MFSQYRYKSTSGNWIKSRNCNTISVPENHVLRGFFQKLITFQILYLKLEVKNWNETDTRSSIFSPHWPHGIMQFPRESSSKKENSLIIYSTSYCKPVWLFLIWNRKQDILKNSYIESQWGPEQHWMPLIFIVWIKNIYISNVHFWMNCPSKAKWWSVGHLRLTFLTSIVSPWYLNGFENSIYWARSLLIVSGATIMSAKPLRSSPIMPFHSFLLLLFTWYHGDNIKQFVMPKCTLLYVYFSRFLTASAKKYLEMCRQA